MRNLNMRGSFANFIEYSDSMDEGETLFKKKFGLEDSQETVAWINGWELFSIEPTLSTPAVKNSLGGNLLGAGEDVQINAFGYWVEQKRSNSNHTKVFSQAMGDNKLGFEAYKLYLALHKAREAGCYETLSVSTLLSEHRKVNAFVLAFVAMDRLWAKKQLIDNI